MRSPGHHSLRHFGGTVAAAITGLSLRASTLPTMAAALVTDLALR